MRRRRLLSTAAVLLLVAGLAETRPADAATTGRTAAGAGQTATLITGEQVTVMPDGDVSVVPGAGGAGIPMLTSTVSGHVRVIPADAVPLLWPAGSIRGCST
jgi:hypothetical protein